MNEPGPWGESAMPNLRVLLCGTTLVAMAVGRGLYQLEPYWAGRRGHEAFIGQSALGSMILIGFCFLIAVFSTFALLVAVVCKLLPGQTGRMNALWQALAFATLIATVLGLCVVTLRPTHEYFLEGFKGYLGECADIPAIQEWSQGLGVGDKIVPNSDWPSSVEKLSPERVSVEGIGEDRQVTLAWGGGFMHWGLTLRENPVRPSCVPWRWVVDLDGISFVWMDAH